MKQKFSYILMLFLLSLFATGAISGMAGLNHAIYQTEFPQVADSTLRLELKRFYNLLQKEPYSSNTEQKYLRLNDFIQSHKITDTVGLSDYFFYRGYYNNLVIGNLSEAASNNLEAVRLRESVGILDKTYARACGNLGTIYNYQGQIEKAIEYGKKGIDSWERIEGSESINLIQSLSNISAAYLNSGSPEEGLQYSLRGIELTQKHGITGTQRSVALLLNTGSIYKALNDYETSKQYFSMAQIEAESGVKSQPDLLVRALNGLAVTEFLSSDFEKSITHYERVISLCNSGLYSGPFLVDAYVNYAFALAKSKRFTEGKEALIKGLELAEKMLGENSREYIQKLSDAAAFRMVYLNDYKGASENLERCMRYVDEHPDDYKLRSLILIDQANLLFLQEKLEEALDILNGITSVIDPVETGYLLRLLKIRSDIYFDQYEKSGDSKLLGYSCDDLVKAIRAVEDNRFEIKTDESRLQIGAVYDSYFTDCLNRIVLLYKNTGDRRYLNLAFNISERSKASTLLASTREATAMKYHIPDYLAVFEKKLRSSINTHKDLLYSENRKEIVNDSLIRIYEENLFNKNRSLDSLISVFEDEYPEYYTLTHNKTVTELSEITKATRRNVNFIEYFYSDTALYIFVANRASDNLLLLPIDRSFRDDLIKFRNIIVNPAKNNKSREQFTEFTDLAYKLYQLLLEPVEPYLVSNNLLIVPDDIIAYIPFEALLTSNNDIHSLNYWDLPYVLDEKDINYALSGTLLAESQNVRKSFKNRAGVFAPHYGSRLYADSLLLLRQTTGDTLTNIPGAREEAIYINSLLGGKIFLDSDATELNFLNETGYCDILHLAVHTLINDRHPMYSKMIFSAGENNHGEQALNTYEVFNMNISAKMVFLSSCNTGSGYLQSGEGVMSLARGFLYAGSPAVVMSLWEIDDQSGSEIVKSFYRNLKKGMSKSRALKLAKKKFLLDKDMLRSHPYFWSTLVIVGDESPIFYSTTRIYAGVLLVFLVLLYIFYRRSAS